MPDILIADDDPHIRDVIAFAVESAGFTYRIAQNGSEALKEFKAKSPDLIILDIGMPEMDGLEVCRAIRQSSQLPILFLTARSDEIDRVLGLELGGDDYVTKPFSPREVVARIKAILKRGKLEEKPSVVLSRGALEVDVECHQCRFKGSEVNLTASEFLVVRALMAKPDVVTTRIQLLDQVYGNNIHVSDRTLDSHVRNLRTKLNAAGCEDAILTVHGVGLRLGSCV